MQLQPQLRNLGSYLTGNENGSGSARVPRPAPRVPRAAPRVPRPACRAPRPASRVPRPASGVRRPAGRLPWEAWARRPSQHARRARSPEIMRTLPSLQPENRDWVEWHGRPARGIVWDRVAWATRPCAWTAIGLCARITGETPVPHDPHGRVAHATQSARFSGSMRNWERLSPDCRTRRAAPRHAAAGFHPVFADG